MKKMNFDAKPGSALTEDLITVSVRDFRAHISRVLNESSIGRKEILITKNNFPSVVMMPVDRYTKLVKMEETCKPSMMPD